MGSRVVQKLRDSGIEVSRDNEILVIEHFESLPKRYALGVKDAMAEVRARNYDDPTMMMTCLLSLVR